MAFRLSFYGVFSLFLVSTVLPAAEAPLAAAERAEPAFHARRLGEAKSPPATIDSMAWLAGRWVGEGLGGYSEETWSGPAGGAMVGTYRLLKDGKAVFYEFLLLTEENGSLILKLKHFSPDLVAWEEKEKFVDFPLVAIENDGRTIHFDGLTFTREADDTLTIHLLLTDRSTGAVREELFSMRRAR